MCALIDAPIQNDKCPFDSAGLAWTAVGIAVARLALASRNNTEFVFTTFTTHSMSPVELTRGTIRARSYNPLKLISNCRVDSSDHCG